MRCDVRALVLCGFACLSASAAQAQPLVLTMSDVLARAREQAPAIIAARLAVDEARGRLAGAELRLQSNPDLELGLGNRAGIGGRFTDFELGLGQMFEPGARRTARVAGAGALIDQRTAEVAETTRLTLRAAATSFLRIVHTGERLRLLEVARELAGSLVNIATRRAQAGEIAALDVNLARATLARMRADVTATEATRILALGELKAALGLQGDVLVSGSIEPVTLPNLDAMLQSALQRPELHVLDAAIAEADAERQLGTTFLKPDYRLGAKYGREEGDHIVFGGVSFSLPFFATGQELRATGGARAARLRADRDAARQRVTTEARASFEALSLRIAAVQVLESDALPGLVETETLATRSFEVGQIDLPDLLVIRREILDTRFQYLDALLETALARVELDASAGTLR